MKEACGKCKWFEFGRSITEGVCHYNPPVFRYWSHGESDGNVLMSEEFMPRVAVGNFCSKFELSLDVNEEIEF